MRRGTIGLAVGLCVFSATGVLQAQVIVNPGAVNFNNAFSAAYGFQFPNQVSAYTQALSAQPMINNQIAQREASMERQQGAVGQDELDQLPGLEDLDPMSFSERDRYTRGGRGRTVRAIRRATMAATVKHGSPMQFYNRSTLSFYPEAAAGSHRNSNVGKRKTTGGFGFGGGMGGGVGGIGMF